MNFEMSHGAMPEDPDYSDFGPDNARFLDEVDEMATEQAGILERPDQDLALSPDIRAANILIDAENHLEAEGLLIDGEYFGDYEAEDSEPATMEELWAQMAKMAEEAVPIKKEQRTDLGKATVNGLLANVALEDEVRAIIEPFNETVGMLEDVESDWPDDGEDLNLAPDARAAIAIIGSEKLQQILSPELPPDDQAS